MAPRQGFRLGLRFRFTVTLTVFIVFIMGAVIALVREQQRAALDKEIRERSLALTRALAANCVEPISLAEARGEEPTLPLMLLVQDVIQTADDPELGKKHLYAAETFMQMLWADLKRLGREVELTGVRNAGVVFARVVDAEGRTMAAADALKPGETWFDELGQPYRPALRTGLLAAGRGETVWNSPALNGMYVVGVPILQRRQEPTPVPAGEAEDTDQTGGEGPALQYAGAVYLGMSISMVRRSLALAVSKLLLVAGAVLVLGGLLAMWIAHFLVKPIHILRDGVLAVAQGDVNKQVHITRRDELGELATSFNEMTKGLAERELIRSAFGAYVSGNILDEILKNPEAMNIGGSRRTITMVDSDVRGFTKMSSSMSPEEVVAVINAYLDVQTKIVLQHQGHIDRFVGDEVLAVFGIPTESSDDAERAVRCAWAIREAIAKLIEERQRQGLPHPRIGIGLDTGHVVAGNMGAQGVKVEFAVIGQPVGTAHDIMEAARDPNVPGGQVVLSENTYERVKDIVEVRELEPLQIHGRSKPLRAFDLVGLKPAGPKGA